MGFDIMVDDKLKPWLLEVNSSPAMAMDGVADSRVKPDLLKDTFGLINFEPVAKYHERIKIWNSKPKDYGQRALKATPVIKTETPKISDQAMKPPVKFFDRRNPKGLNTYDKSAKRLDSTKNEHAPV